jgi:site-specific DNA recombinase
MPPKGEHPAKGWAAAYGRVSEIRTDIAQDSPENQVRVYRQGAHLHGLKIKPGYEFSDHGKSASRDVERRDLERAIRAVVRQEVEALVVPNMDRLSRRGMRHVGGMLDEVEGAQGRIIFVRETLDSSQPMSRAIIAFLAEKARGEAADLSWRIETWHEGCRLKGKWTGRHPYGYSVVDGRLVPHPVEAPIVRRIVADFLSGRPTRSIVKSLNNDGILSPAAAKASTMQDEGRESKSRIDPHWHATAVSRLLRNPALVGWQRHNGRIVLGPDGEPVSFGEGILTPGEHARVLAEMESRTATVRKRGRKRQVGARTGGGRPPRYLLVGLARCSACRSAMAAQTSSGRNAAYYRCGTLSDGRPCPAPPHIRIQDADDEVMDQLRTRLTFMEPDNPIVDAIAERWRDLTMPEGEDEQAVLQSRLDAVRGRIVDLDEARFVRGQYTAAEDVARWEAMMERLKAQRDAVLADLDDLGPPPDFDLDILRATFSSSIWDMLSMAERRRHLQCAVAKVVVRSVNKRRGVPAADRVRVFLVGEEPAADDSE